MSVLNVITGFHRSGTSCLAGMLFHAGLPMGALPDFLEPRPANEKGFYEHRRFMELNQRLLQGTSWPTELPAQIPPPLVSEMRHTPPGLTVKDPRFCLTLGYWKQCREIRKVLVMLRRPEECVASLVARGRDQVSRSFEWYYNFYLTTLFSELQNRDWCAVTYDDVMGDPATVLKRIEKYVQCPLDIRAGMTFTESRLRHHCKPAARWPDICVKLLNSPY